MTFSFRVLILIITALFLATPSLHGQGRLQPSVPGIPPGAPGITPGAPGVPASPPATQPRAAQQTEQEDQQEPDEDEESETPKKAPAPPPGRPPRASAPTPPTPPPFPARPPQAPVRSVAPPTGPGARMAGSRPAATTQSGRIKMNFDSIELRDLIRFISNVIGKNFVFDEAVVKGRVSILSPKDLTKDEVYRVFTTVMNYYGFAVVPTPEATKIVRQTDAKGMALEKLDMDLPPEDRFMTYVHSLHYLDANTMVGVLRPMLSKDAFVIGVASTNSLIMIDTGSNIHRIRKIIDEIDVPVSRKLGSLKVYNVQHTSATDLAKTIQAVLTESKKAPSPQDKIFITSYTATNSLLISAPPEDMIAIERIISELDTLRPQVLVEAAIIEITTTRGNEVGVEWAMADLDGTLSPSGVMGGFSSAVGGAVPFYQSFLNNPTDPNKAISTAAGTLQGGFNIGVLAGQITYQGKKYPALGAFVRALSTLDNVNILSTPQLLTVSNEEAEIIVGENRPYVTSSRLDASGNPTYSYDYRDVGIKLKVKPQINKDGYVNLNIYQEVSKINLEASTGSTSPTTLKRSTKTTVVVKDSQTVVISGLIKDDVTAGRRGIPFLSSIPIIGYFFGNRTVTNEKTNLLVFLTPRIIYSSEALQEISNIKKQEQDKFRKDNEQP
jgi:general secretion pathway protein D